MGVLGTGVDVVLISRIERSLDRYGDRFVARVYTSGEKKYCAAKKRGSAQAYAVRFAAKEAVAKALGIGIRRGINFKDIEVVLDDLGKPSIELHGGAAEAATERGVDRVHLALSHESDWAVAYALVEGSSP